MRARFSETLFYWQANTEAFPSKVTSVLNSKPIHAMFSFQTSFDVKKIDRYQGDIILTKETADVVLGGGPYGLRPRTFWPTDHNPTWDYIKRKRQRQGRRRRVKRKVLSDLQYFWQGAVVPWRFADNGAFSELCLLATQR